MIVDVQNDFCPGGSLPVLTGDMVIEPINDMIAHATAQGWLIVASQDWHPEHTVHFAQDRSDGKGWPVHCVQNTRGAEFHPKLKINNQVVVFRKGLDPTSDSGYSAFEGDSDGQSLDEVLYQEDVRKIFVVGLATDYCVKATVLDALKKHPFKVTLVLDAIRAVNIGPIDGIRAVAEMVSAGALFATAEEVIRVEK